MADLDQHKKIPPNSKQRMGGFLNIGVTKQPTEAPFFLFSGLSYLFYKKERTDDL
ncbi:hypothetical protein ACR75O_06170 [Streptococcus lutetiensis]